DQVITGAHLEVEQRSDLWLAARLIVPHQDPLTFQDFHLGFGWRAIYPTRANTVELDLETLGDVPDHDDVDHADFSRCSTADTRVIVALSGYPEVDGLLALAETSAEAAGAPMPSSWYDVVRDPAMYALLFEQHYTIELAEATFAFLSVELHPLCDDVRMVLAAERELVGPIKRHERATLKERSLTPSGRTEP